MIGPELLRRFRRTGADPPFGDPRRAHGGVALEGYFWRLTDVARGRVVIVLCGASRAPRGRWANVAVAAHPGGHVNSRVVAAADADRERFRVMAGDVLRAEVDHLAVRLGEDRLEVRLADRAAWPRRAFGALGPAQAVPGLSQYWHPHLLGARVEGGARIAGEEFSLDGATAYAEKNWGAGFPSRWWWGQAQGFEDPAACVAFAGGAVSLAGVPLGTASAVVAHVAGETVRLAPPGALVEVDGGDGHWRLRARGARHSVLLEGEANGNAPHVLPVPVPAERRERMAARQHLAGRVRLEVRRGRRTLFRGTSELAGLERGNGKGAGGG